MTRLQHLRQRREKLIQLNILHKYSQCGHAKGQKYFDVLLVIRKEINKIECINVHPANTKIGMTAKDLRELTETR